MEVMFDTFGFRALRRERAWPKETLGMGVPSVHITLREALSEGLEDIDSGFFR